MFYVDCKSRPVCGLILLRRLALISVRTFRLALNSLRRSRLYPLSWLRLEQDWVLALRAKHVGRCLILCYFNPRSTFNELPFSQYAEEKSVDIKERESLFRPLPVFNYMKSKYKRFTIPPEITMLL